MADGPKTAYGFDVAGGRRIGVRAVRHGVPQALPAVAQDSEEARRALQAVARDVEKGVAALAVAAPAAQTVVRRLRAPFASAKKAAKVWASLLDVELPFPVESAVCVYGESRVEKGGTLAIASAVRRSDLAAFDEACRAAGFDPTHCDAEALALWSQQAVEAPPARAELPRVLVWLAADHVSVVRGRGAEFMAAHVLRASPLGDGAPAFEALWASRAPQILRAHLAETGGTDVDLWWAGPGAGDEALMARLRRAVPADFGVRHEIHRQPASFLARALARRAADGTGVNFKSGEWTHPAIARANARGLKRAVLGVVAASLVVLALNAGEAVLRRQRIDALQRQLTEEARAIAGDPVPFRQERLIVERAISRRDEEMQPFRTAADAVGLEGRLLGVLAAAESLGVEFSRLGLSPAALSIDGSAAHVDGGGTFAERLRELDWSVQSDSPGRTPEGRQRFILKGTVGHEG